MVPRGGGQRTRALCACNAVGVNGARPAAGPLPPRWSWSALSSRSGAERSGRTWRVAPHRRLCRLLAAWCLAGVVVGGAHGAVLRWPSRSFCPRLPVDDAAHRRVRVAEGVAVTAVGVGPTTLHWARAARALAWCCGRRPHPSACRPRTRTPSWRPYATCQWPPMGGHSPRQGRTGTGSTSRSLHPGAQVGQRQHLYQRVPSRPYPCPLPLAPPVDRAAQCGSDGHGQGGPVERRSGLPQTRSQAGWHRRVAAQQRTGAATGVEGAVDSHGKQL